MLLSGCLLGTGCADNRAPVFDPLPTDREVTVGESLRFPVRAVDRDGDRVRYGARGLPVGADFDRTLDPPVFRWAPVASDAEADGRPHPVTFIAEDEAGARTEARVVLTVWSGGSRPRVTSPAAHVVPAGSALDVWVEVRDDDSLAVRFDLVEAPAGAVLRPERKRARLLWTPSAAQMADRSVFGFLVRVWDDDPAAAVEQRITVVVSGG